MIVMSLVNYESSSESSEDESLPLKDPLKLVPHIQKPSRETSVVQNPKKRTLNAYVETQAFDLATFELKRREYMKQQRKQKTVWDSPELSEEEPDEDEPVQVEAPKEKTEQFTSDLLVDVFPEAPVKHEIEECFVPKKLVHTWDAHLGSVTCMRYVPKTGHLLLSGGSDKKLIMYNTRSKKKEILRIFSGHKQAIKAVEFSRDGSFFVSSSYDKTVVVWDTQTGKAKSHFKPKGVANCLSMASTNDYELLAGLSDSKIEHYDLRAPTNSSDHLIQLYDHHMDAVTAINFVDGDQKFVSTSDDRSIRIWNNGINVPVKSISDPAQFSMPRIKVYPGGKYFAAQGMDNSITVYQARDRFKQNKKKVFRGHDTAGHGIDLDFSPDGKIIMSGGASGRVFFWDWKSCKMVKDINVGKGRTMNCVAADPQAVSGVAVGGEGGSVYLYE